MNEAEDNQSNSIAECDDFTPAQRCVLSMGHEGIHRTVDIVSDVERLARQAVERLRLRGLLIFDSAIPDAMDIITDAFRNSTAVPDERVAEEGSNSVVKQAECDVHYNVGWIDAIDAAAKIVNEARFDGTTDLREVRARIADLKRK